MTVNRIVVTSAERDALIKYVTNCQLPITVTIKAGKHRTLAQNSLQRRWMQEIAEHMDGHTPEQIRGYCKLHLAVPILREENHEFRERYDAIIKPLPYEHKVAAMMEPLDMPVTRLFTTKQKTRYLDAIVAHFAERGIVLSMPEDMRSAA